MKEENSKTKKTTAKAKTNKSTKTVAEKKNTTASKTKKNTNTAKSTKPGTKKASAKKSSDTKSVKNTEVKSKPSKKEEVKIESIVEKKEVVATENNNTKKAIVIAILVVLLLGILFFISEKNNTAFVEPVSFTDEEQADLKSISVNDYLNLKAGSDTSVIYIARPTCSHCVTQTPRMKYIKYKYGVEINYLNTDEFDQEGTDYEKLASSDSFFDEGFGTPTTLIVQNDKIVDSISGESEISDLVKLFKKYNLIKE